MTYAPSTKPFVVGLAGGSGSGKTTLARILSSSLPWPTTVVPLDQFYADLSHLSLEDRKKVNFDVPESLDMELAYQTVYQLSLGLPTQTPVYDFENYNRSAETQLLQPSPVILFEGMHALYHTPLLELFDVGIFLDIDEGTRWERKLERDIRERGRSYHSVLQMWEEYTKPMHNIYVQPTQVRANLVFTDSFAPQVLSVITQVIEQKICMRQNVVGVLP